MFPIIPHERDICKPLWTVFNFNNIVTSASRESWRLTLRAKFNDPSQDQPTLDENALPRKLFYETTNFLSRSLHLIGCADKQANLCWYNQARLIASSKHNYQLNTLLSVKQTSPDGANPLLFRRWCSFFLSFIIDPSTAIKLCTLLECRNVGREIGIYNRRIALINGDGLENWCGCI